MASLFAAFLVAITPWHIYISRLGHESNAYLSFFIFGILFFLQGLQSSKKMFLSVFFFTLSMISYYAGQVIVPMMILFLIFIFKNQLIKTIKSNKKIIIPIFITAVLLIPIFWSLFSPEALIRFRGTSTFSPQAHGEMFAKEEIGRAHV